MAIIAVKLQRTLIGKRWVQGLTVMLMCGVLSRLADADQGPVRPISSVVAHGKHHRGGMVTGHETAHNRRLATLVEDPQLILSYHNGPVMGTKPLIPLYIIWYGPFSMYQTSTFRDFFSCFVAQWHEYPSVKSWWNVTAAYKDNTGSAVSGTIKVQGELYDSSCSRGTSITNDDLESLVLSSLSNFPTSPDAMYLVLTADNVFVEDFCMNSCASHFSTRPGAGTKGHQLPYLWVGNSATQCPGECAWPFARPDYGPPDAPLIAPNGDVGVDGMIINLAAMLAGSATNPFNTGFYQGDASAPLEAGTACTGIYGAGAYPGFPGELMVDKQTGASFNAHGVGQRKYLLPALWNPYTLSCTAP